MTKPHNPNYKLISTIIDGNELVYGETNEGQNKGLEVYYKTGCSRRFAWGVIPERHFTTAKVLRSLINSIPNGHKATI